MELYVITNDKGRILGDKAFVSSKVAKQARDDLKFYIPYRNEGFHVNIINVEDNKYSVGRHIYFAYIYRGFDYGWESIYDVISQDSQYYTCKSELKAGEFWTKWAATTQGKEDNFNFYEDRICSRDTFGEDWFYGDVMEDNFVLEIRKLRVIKAAVYEIES